MIDTVKERKALYREIMLLMKLKYGFTDELALKHILLEVRGSVRPGDIDSDRVDADGQAK